MRIIINILLLGFQIGLTFITLFIIFMIFAILDSDWGFDGFVGLGFQVIWAIIFSAATIFCCGIIGLPLRFVSAIDQWWTKHFYIAIFLILIGLCILVISATPQFTEQTVILLDGREVSKQIPNITLALTGWFITAFSTLHLYPPAAMINYFSTLKIKSE